MTTPPPTPAPVVAAPRVVPARPRRRFRRFLLAIFLLLLLAAGSLFIPAVFQFALRGLLTAEAWRHGSHLEIEEVAGSFSEPVRLTNTRWTFNSHAGSVARVDIEEAEANFDWPAVFPWQGGRWFKRLALKGVVGRLEIPVATVKRDLSTPSAAWRAETVVPQWWPAPAVVEAGGVDLTVLNGENWTRIQDSRWTISELDSGVVEAGQIALQQPWINRVFRNVHGTTRLQSSQILIADVQLDKDVLITSATADLTKFATGVLDLDLQIDAFGGKIRAQAETIPQQREVLVDASIPFSNINVASLANFLGVSEAAGGLIDEGKLNFRGTVADLSGSNSSLRFTARNFQWDSRQWDSLVLGATLADRRVQIPEFKLRQGKNELSLNGEFALPKAGVDWWKTEFAVDVSGRIENLTELSALLLPDFQYAAGKATIDGSIRGRDQQFHGQLIVSGSDLTWKKAPIQELHAALQLNGNELKLANLDLINKDDYVHGRGVINILGAKQYWGEFRASVEDLATYSSLMEKPIVPEPLAGGAMLNWSGEGSAERYSGAFFARLQKIRSLGTTGAQLHPVNAELEGAYAPGALQFSRFNVSDDTSSFSAKVQLGQKSVSLSEIQLKQGMETRLEGDAMLPLDVWSAWPGGDLTQLLTENGPVQFNLKASNLRLAEALRLSGWNWPLDGGVSGDIWGKGAGFALDLGGSLQLREGKLPLGWNGDVLSNVSADVSLAGPKVAIARASLTHASGKFEANGAIDLQNLRDPWLDLGLLSYQATVRLLPNWNADVAPTFERPAQRLGLTASTELDLRLQGPAGKSTINGRVAVLGFATEQPLDLRSFWSSTGSMPAFFGWSAEPWASCQLDLKGSIGGHAIPSSNEFQLPPELAKIEAREGCKPWRGDFQITGTGAAPEMTGAVALDAGNQDFFEPKLAVTITSNGFPLQVTAGSITFHPGVPIDPTVDFAFIGYLHSLPFHASIFGPLSHRISFIDDEEARQLILGTAPLSLKAGELQVPGSKNLAQPGPGPAMFEPGWKPLVLPWMPPKAAPAPAGADSSLPNPPPAAPPIQASAAPEAKP